MANHPFVDGNKRTALDTTSTFYLLNELEFDYDDEVREILGGFATDADSIAEAEVIEYLEANTRPIELDDVIAEFRDDLVEWGLENLDSGTDDDPTA